MKGIIKFYNDERGFGFVTHEDGVESFFHHSAVLTPGTPQNGASVEFDLEVRDDCRTPRAKLVRPNPRVRPHTNHRSDKRLRIYSSSPAWRSA